MTERKSKQYIQAEIAEEMYHMQERISKAHRELPHEESDKVRQSEWAAFRKWRDKLMRGSK